MPTYQQDMQKVARQRQLAQLLQQQSMQPQLQNAGQFMVGPTPLSGVTALADALGGIAMTRRADKGEKTATDMERARLSDALSRMSGAQQADPNAPVDPTQQAAREYFNTLPVEAQGTVLGNQALTKLFPPLDEYTLGKDQVRIRNGKQVAAGPKEDQPLDDVAKARADLQAGRMTQEEYDARVKKLNNIPSPIAVNVNTEKSLYGTMAEQQGKAVVDLYGQAQKAPDLLQRAQRVKAALGPGSQAITGAGADWRLAGAKVANQLGFNTGNAASDTESLARELAASTLDNIKSSGLGGGSGFSNADRDFLEKVVGGKITLESKTLSHVADLNEKSALATIQRWNATASRLSADQLKTLGMAPIQMPTGSPPVTAKPKLQRNPDGSYSYSP